MGRLITNALFTIMISGCASVPEEQPASPTPQEESCHLLPGTAYVTDSNNTVLLKEASEFSDQVTYEYWRPMYEDNWSHAYTTDRRTFCDHVVKATRHPLQ